MPDYIYILCYHCRKFIFKMMKDTEELTCSCGQIVKNPYCKGGTND